MTADDVIAVARAAIGTPFRHQGRIVGVGLDCAGLLVHVMQQLGVPYHDVQGYSRLPHHGRLKATLDAQPSLERVSTMQPGDFLLMRFKVEPQHLGICTGDRMVHSWADAGKVAEHEFGPEWQARVVVVYRIKGLS